MFSVFDSFESASFVGSSLSIFADVAGGAARTEAGEAVFGFYWPKFIAQLVLFGLVYWVLEKKAFGPIVAMLEARRTRIEETEMLRAQVEKDLEVAGETSREMIAKADGEAGRLVSEARESAAALAEKKRVEMTAEAAQILLKAREASELDRARVMAQLQVEFGRLVSDTAARVTGKVLNEGDKNRLNQETVSSISN